jgi:CRP-like cAMP-binding protein
MEAELLDHARELLEAHPTFGVEAADVARVLAAGTLRRTAPGDVLCTEGEVGDAMFFLLGGTVRVQRRDSQGRMRELAEMHSPALVGHMSLVDNSPRSANCIATERTILVSMDRRTYATILSEPSARGTALRRMLLSSLMQQLGGANDRIRALLGQAPKASPVKPRVEARPADPREVEDFDVADSDLVRIAGMLEGWKADPRTLRMASKAEAAPSEDPTRPHLRPRR